MSADRDRREAVAPLIKDHMQHQRETGVAVPDSRKAENWAAENLRLNERTTNDSKPKTPRR